MPAAALLKTANENFRQLERPSFSFFEVLSDHQRFKSGERGYACRAPGICIEEMRLGGIRTNLLFTMSDITRATAEAAGANLFFQSGPVFAPSEPRRGKRKLSGLPSQCALARRLVEPDGIEPTTSCLQSTRSPN
jgi:hypothetical protein